VPEQKFVLPFNMAIADGFGPGSSTSMQVFTREGQEDVECDGNKAGRRMWLIRLGMITLPLVKLLVFRPQ